MTLHILLEKTVFCIDILTAFITVGWDWHTFVRCKIWLEVGAFIFIFDTILKNIKFYINWHGKIYSSSSMPEKIDFKVIASNGKHVEATCWIHFFI